MCNGKEAVLKLRVEVLRTLFPWEYKLWEKNVPRIYFYFCSRYTTFAIRYPNKTLCSMRYANLQATGTENVMFEVDQNLRVLTAQGATKQSS